MANKRPSKQDERRMMAVLKQLYNDETAVIMDLSLWQVWLLISALQFTIRNSKSDTTHERWMTTLAIQLSMVIKLHYPAAKVIIDMGFDEDYDVTENNDTGGLN